MSNFMKIHPADTDLFYADGRTDIKKLTVAFRNFAERTLKNTHTYFSKVFTSFV